MGDCVQGSIYEITGTFIDPGIGQVADPPDVRVYVENPKTTHATVLVYSEGQVQRLGTGVYQYGIDTTPASGKWNYAMEGTGPKAIRQQGFFIVDEWELG